MSRNTGIAPAFDVQKLRQDFPILNQRVHGKPLVYLDNAATTQKPQSVIDTMVRSYAEENANIHRGVHVLSERATRAYEEAREKVRGFLNAPDPREIIFVRGTTEAINLVAQTFGRANIGIERPHEKHGRIGRRRFSLRNIGVPPKRLRKVLLQFVRSEPVDSAGV